MNENIIGIDLGTTMSAIAKLNDLGTPEIIPNEDGERIMPSVINFISPTSILIGEEAKNAAVTDPSRVVKEFKRKMDNLDYKFKIDNKKYSASELSAMVLKKLVQDASEKIGDIDKVVITVPAYFKENQRNATMEAGKIAGLDVISIINEPTAAALYYAKESKMHGCGIVYDLGGGTFDITLMNTESQKLTILGAEGNPKLGGIDFDKIVLDIMREKYKNITGNELCANDESQEEFSQIAEEIKKSLSKRTSVKKLLKGVSSNAKIEITREEFEDKASILITKTEILLEQLLDESYKTIKDIDYVLLVGGSTRIPAIRESIKNRLKLEPLNTVNVDEVVALGAAIQAGLVMMNRFPTTVKESIKPNLVNLVLQDVANHSYGTIFISSSSDNKVNEIIIKKNTPLPCVKKTSGVLLYDGQKYVECQITQGEGVDIKWIDIIDKFNLSISNYDTKKGNKVEFVYSYDENQIMHCTVTHLLSGSTIEKSINITSNKLTPIRLDKFLIE